MTLTPTRTRPRVRLTNQALAKVADDLLTNGGGTYFAHDLTPVPTESVWCVGLTGGEEFSADPEIGLPLPQRIAWHLATIHGTEFVGTWLHEGRIYLDPVALIPDRDNALALAREHDQIAIYNLATAETVTVKGE
jgi:hypothetical protein